MKLNKRRISKALDDFAALPQDQRKPQKLAHDGGLYLHLMPTGAAVWRLKYRVKVDGKLREKLYTIGPWPDVDIEAAEDEARVARGGMKDGRDPVLARRLAKAERFASEHRTFGDLAAEWLEVRRPGWSTRHYDKSKRAIERDILPTLGRLPVADITPRMVSGALEPVERRAGETSRRIRQHVALIFDMALAKGLRNTNPVIRAPGRSRATGRQQSRQPALTALPDLGGVLRAAEAANISLVVREASWLLAHTVVRPGELLPATWEEFELDGDDPRWTIPRSRMKRQGTVKDHAIPLAPEVVARLRRWRAMFGDDLVFPSFTRRREGRPITVEALEKAYRVTLGLRGRHVPHGWRASFSSLSHDAIDAKGQRRWPEDVVEMALDHVHGGKVRLAYDRGERWDKRRELMEWWARELSVATDGAEVIRLGANKLALEAG